MSKHQNIPHLEIVAGPNGSGKTTFAQSYLVRTLKRANDQLPEKEGALFAKKFLKGKI